MAYRAPAILGGMPDDSSQSADRFTLRFPPGLRERVKAATRSSGRSLNGEIIALIEAGLDGGGKVDVDDLAGRIVDALVARLAASASDPKSTKRKRG